MAEIQEVGIVLYTYGELETKLEALWDWIGQAEAWSGRAFTEFNFSSRAKDSLRVWKASAKNRAMLRERLANEQPWAALTMGWPSIRADLPRSYGASLFINSKEAKRLAYRGITFPSYVYFSADVSLFAQNEECAREFVSLALQGWQAMDTPLLGFIDLQTDIPPQDDLFRNASPIWFSPTNQDTPREFQAWQCIQYDLDKRLWKAFWGNVLGAEHVRRIGGLQEMQGPGAGEESVSSDLLEQAYAQGLAKLKDCACYQGWRELGDGAVFLSLSPSPLDWFSEEVQARRERLQQALGHVAVGPWDWDAYPSR